VDLREDGEFQPAIDTGNHHVAMCPTGDVAWQLAFDISLPRGSASRKSIDKRIPLRPSLSVIAAKSARVTAGRASPKTKAYARGDILALRWPRAQLGHRVVGESCLT